MEIRMIKWADNMQFCTVPDTLKCLLLQKSQMGWFSTGSQKHLKNLSPKDKINLIMKNMLRYYELCKAGRRCEINWIGIMKSGLLLHFKNYL